MASKILLVEDNADDAELTRLALERHQLGSKVVHLTDGAQVIDYLFGANGIADALEVRFIILDLKLPKVDGLEVLKKIKGDTTLRHIPVVILTSSAAEQDLRACYDNYANSFLSKPVDFEKFHQMVQELDFYWSVCNRPPANVA